MSNGNAIKVIKFFVGSLLLTTGVHAQIIHLPTQCSDYDNNPNECRAYPECQFDRFTNQCEDNFGGHHGGGGNAVVINCSSDNFRYSECQAGGNVLSVRLLHQDSHAACRLNSSFGSRGNAIYVDRGCRGSFEVVLGFQRPDLQTLTLSCSSDNYRLENCQVGAQILSVRLIRQDSRSACVLNSTYGSAGTSIWVSRGCRGVFEVTTGFIRRL